jgi:hypothetical protein
MPSAYGFSADDAKRIGRAVRVVERLPPGNQTSGPVSPSGGRGVRIMLGTAGSAAWSKATTQTITVMAGPPGSTGKPTNSAGTIVAYNIFANLTTSAAMTSRWCAVSNNGFGWYLIAAECS